MAGFRYGDHRYGQAGAIYNQGYLLLKSSISSVTLAVSVLTQRAGSGPGTLLTVTDAALCGLTVTDAATTG